MSIVSKGIIGLLVVLGLGSIFSSTLAQFIPLVVIALLVSLIVSYIARKKNKSGTL